MFGVWGVHAPGGDGGGGVSYGRADLYVETKLQQHRRAHLSIQPHPTPKRALVPCQAAARPLTPPRPHPHHSTLLPSLQRLRHYDDHSSAGNPQGGKTEGRCCVITQTEGGSEDSCGDRGEAEEEKEYAQPRLSEGAERHNEKRRWWPIPGCVWSLQKRDEGKGGVCRAYVLQHGFDGVSLSCRLRTRRIGLSIDVTM